MNTIPSLAILFSGGTDSLALYAMSVLGNFAGIQPPQTIHLLHFLNGMSRYPEFPRQRLRICRELLGVQRGGEERLPATRYLELDTGRLFQGLWLDRFEILMPQFNGKNLVCVACKVAMHARAIIYCVTERIPLMMTGYARRQQYYPEQTPAFMDRLQTFSREFGVETKYPVFEAFADRSAARHYLEDQGLPSAGGGERDCLFSQTYTTADETDTARYLDAALPLVRRYLEAVLEGDTAMAAACFPPGRIGGELINSGFDGYQGPGSPSS